jgi:hypothetical protein
VESVRAFLAAHGSTRFESLGNTAGDDADFSAGVSLPAMGNEPRVVNRAGWKRAKSGVWEFLILPDPWKDDVCRGLNPPARWDWTARTNTAN